MVFISVTKYHLELLWLTLWPMHAGDFPIIFVFYRAEGRPLWIQPRICSRNKCHVLYVVIQLNTWSIYVNSSWKKTSVIAVKWTECVFAFKRLPSIAPSCLSLVLSAASHLLWWTQWNVVMRIMITSVSNPRLTPAKDGICFRIQRDCFVSV